MEQDARDVQAVNLLLAEMRYLPGRQKKEREDPARRRESKARA